MVNADFSANTGVVLVGGATGYLGRQVVEALLARGKRVRALVRPASNASALKVRGVEIVRGDLLDPTSLPAACDGVDAVVSTAIGYSARRPGDFAADTDVVGHRHLIDAAANAQVRRFVYTSILTCDRAPDVPHFHAKKLVEDQLAASGLPFIALRPGAFIDQAADFWIAGLRKGRLDVLGDPTVRWSYIHTHDLATLLAAAVDLPVDAPSRLDIGCDRAVSARDIAASIATLVGREIRVRALPWAVASPLLWVQGLRNPWMADMRAMFRYLLGGGYVADLASQSHWFGAPPRIESALQRYLEANSLLPTGIRT